MFISAFGTFKNTTRIQIRKKREYLLRKRQFNQEPMKAAVGALEPIMVLKVPFLLLPAQRCVTRMRTAERLLRK